MKALILLKHGMSQIVKNETPIYEIISGAALGLLPRYLLILPGFATDFISSINNFSTHKKIDFKKNIK